MAVNFAISIVLDTAVVTSDEVRNDLLRRVLEACKASGQTTTTAMGTWVTGGTPTVKITLT